jgi:hypothetical protein
MSTTSFTSPIFALKYALSSLLAEIFSFQLVCAKYGQESHVSAANAVSGESYILTVYSDSRIPALIRNGAQVGSHKGMAET